MLLFLPGCSREDSNETFEAIESYTRRLDAMPEAQRNGYGKGALIDFNYETEPLPGNFPLPGVGPFGLLKNTKMNHYGKMLFRWIYWHILLKGRELPVEADMTMAGKIRV